MDLYALGGHDLPDDRAADGDAAGVDFAFDLRALADDQLVLRHDLAVETAVDAHRVFEFELAAKRRAAIEETIQFTALVLHLSSHTTVSAPSVHRPRESVRLRCRSGCESLRRGVCDRFRLSFV